MSLFIPFSICATYCTLSKLPAPFGKFLRAVVWGVKGKILCPAGCQNPVARITKAKEILKNPRPAGSWRPLKCIFSGKGKSRSQRAAKPRSGVILAKGKKAAHSGPQALSCPFYVRKNQTGAVCGSLRASFYHGAKIRNSAVLSLAGNLLGSAFPKPCYAACAAKRFPFGRPFFCENCPGNT